VSLDADEMTIGTGDHVVQFYEHDSELVLRVGQYLVAGLRAGEVVVVVATPEHRRAFDAELAAADIDLVKARRDGRFISLDASDTMSRFITDGRPDPAGFDSVIGALIRSATACGRPVRAYGEMVALLWDAGNVMEAIELEALWNDLGRELAFSLFCAYPSHSVSSPEHSDALREVCHLHSAVVHQRAPSDRSRRSDASCQFDPELNAPADARRFVVETVRRWGYDGDLLEDAAVVVTELASNVVVHARLPFTVTLSPSQGGGVRISVQDGSRTRPVQRQDGPTAQSGRGLTLIAALARSWGVDTTPDGKVVWAELQ
jgi:anti-sigma regulatory factor (Ser/Thr protein kinase)